MQHVAQSSNDVAASPEEQRAELTVIAGAPAHQASAPTVGAALKRLRLVHRMRRIERVLDVLHGSARARSSSGTAPVLLTECIADFSRELDQLREQLAMSTAPERAPVVTFLGRAGE